MRRVLPGPRGRIVGVATALLALSLAAAPAAQGAAWAEPAPGPLNVDPGREATVPSLADVGGVAHVAWQEDTAGADQVRVKRLSATGTAWEQPVPVALNFDPTKGAANPSLAAVGGVPYVAWQEDAMGVIQIRVKRLIGGAWQEPVAGPLNAVPGLSASDPSIADVGGVPYVAWTESNGAVNQIRVKRLIGGVWQEPVAGPLSGIGSAGSPSVAAVDGVPHVAWNESVGLNSQIRVKRLVGGAWLEPVAGPLNIVAANNATLPRVASVGGVPHVAWNEFNAVALAEVRVKRLTGSSWQEPVPGPLNVDPTKPGMAPSLAALGGVPYAAWEEVGGAATDFQIRVRRLGGSAWEEPVPGPLNVDPGKRGQSASLAAAGGVPYVAWQELAPPYQIRVKRFVPDPAPPGAPSPQGAATGPPASETTPAVPATKPCPKAKKKRKSKRRNKGKARAAKKAKKKKKKRKKGPCPKPKKKKKKKKKKKR